VLLAFTLSMFARRPGGTNHSNTAMQVREATINDRSGESGVPYKSIDVNIPNVKLINIVHGGINCMTLKPFESLLFA